MRGLTQCDAAVGAATLLAQRRCGLSASAPGRFGGLASLGRMAVYLLVIGDREALGWILRTDQMAFPATRRSEVTALAPGDRLFLYTTRGCFRNPGRDRGRVIGTSVAMSPVRDLKEPVVFSGRSFVRGLSLRHESLAPLGAGTEIAPLVPRLDCLRGAGEAWAVRLRRSLVRVTDGDTRLLERTLRDSAERPPRPCDVAAYARWFDARAAVSVGEPPVS